MTSGHDEVFGREAVMTAWKFGKVAFGGDWNPEQWDEDSVLEDIALFAQAGIDLLSINVFGWTLCQPSEEVYDFSYLDWIVGLLRKAGMRVCMGTGTAAHPAWMARSYPDILRTDFQGRVRKFGDRHNSCPSSPAYHRFAPELARRLAEHFRDEPSIVMWHVSNEFMGACYCEHCRRQFHDWLRRRYSSLDALNNAWNSRFWNQYLSDWDEIELPNVLTVQWGDRNTAMPQISLDFNRFNSDNILGMYTMERDAIRSQLPNALITTNFMGPYRGLDYRRWAPELDIVAWDSYPGRDSPPAETAFNHSLMRGLKPDGHFLLMEQTPSQTNWAPYNALKRPGVMRLESYQALAQGSDSLLFFQMRRSRGGCEKFHGAVIEHSGRSDVRVFQEVAELGAELEALGPAFEAARYEAKAAIWFDWNCWWGLENSMGPNKDLQYLDLCRQYYSALYRSGFAVDVVGPGSDLGEYRLLLAPACYLLEDSDLTGILDFVSNGGSLLCTVMSGVADTSDRVFRGGAPGPLKDLLGIWSEEVDALPPDEANEIVLAGGVKATCHLVFDLIHSQGAEVLACYGKDFYAGRPALTRNDYGSGRAYYLASFPEQAFLDNFLPGLAKEAGIEALLDHVPEKVEVGRRRTKDGEEVYFILNFNEEAVRVGLDNLVLHPLPSGEEVKGSLVLEGRGVFIGKRRRQLSSSYND